MKGTLSVHFFVLAFPPSFLLIDISTAKNRINECHSRHGKAASISNHKENGRADLKRLEGLEMDNKISDGSERDPFSTLLWLSQHLVNPFRRTIKHDAM